MKKLIFVLLLCTVSLASFSQLASAQTSETKISQKHMTKIDLNKASLAQLISLSGVGKTKAAAIIEHRTKNGKFKSVEDLLDVKGVGKKTLNKLRNQLTVS
jgi:competence protein ComEA